MRLVCERDEGFRREKARLEGLGKALRRMVERRVGRSILAVCGVVLGVVDGMVEVWGSRIATREGFGATSSVAGSLGPHLIASSRLFTPLHLHSCVTYHPFISHLRIHVVHSPSV